MDGLLWIAGICALILVIYLVDEHWPRKGDALQQHLYRKWLASCRARGLTPQQEREEYLFRYSWARMSRRISEKIIATGASAYSEIISDIAADETKILAIADKAVAKRFLAVVNSAPLGDILSPEAMEKVYEFLRIANGWRPAPSADAIAALTTRR